MTDPQNALLDAVTAALAEHARERMMDRFGADDAQ